MDPGGVMLWDHGAFRKLASAAGLSQKAVRQLLETRDGTVWVATDGAGIYCYKDERWTTLTMKDGLPSDHIWALAEAPEGGIWVGGGGVSFCRDGTCKAVRTAREGLPNDRVAALAVTRSGDLWVGTLVNGLSRLSHGTWTDWTSRDGLPGGVVRAIAEDKDGNLWIGTSEGLCRFREGRFTAMTRAQGAAGACS